MLEVLLIMSIVYACLLMPLRGKEFQQLSQKQQQRVSKHYSKHMATKKGKMTPGMTVEQYLPIMQKQAITYLVMALIIFPIYVLAIYFLYSPIFAEMFYLVSHF